MLICSNIDIYLDLSKKISTTTIKMSLRLQQGCHFFHLGVDLTKIVLDLVIIVLDSNFYLLIKFMTHDFWNLQNSWSSQFYDRI